MKTRLLLPIVLILALAAPVAISTAAHNDAEPQAQIAKKKRKQTWCQKKGKSAKGKLVSKVKAAKFFLYTTKRPTEYFFCSESHKFTGTIAEWGGIKKTSHVRAVKKNCAVFFSESKRGSGWDAGAKYLKVIPYKFFRKGSKYPKQTQAGQLGAKDDAVTVYSVSLAKNCVVAVAYAKNGVPTLRITGVGDFGYQGWVTREIPGATIAELKKVRVVYNNKDSATVKWTQGGVPNTYDYNAK